MSTYTYYSGFTDMLHYIETSCYFESGTTRVGHKQLRSFGYGEISDKAVEGNDLYPRAFLEYPVFGSYETPTTIRWDLALIVNSLELLERTDERTKLDVCQKIVNDLVIKFREDGQNTNFTLIEDSIKIINLTEFTDDVTAGWRMEFSLNQTINQIRCPLSDNFILSYDQIVTDTDCDCADCPECPPTGDSLGEIETPQYVPTSGLWSETNNVWRHEGSSGDILQLNYSAMTPDTWYVFEISFDENTNGFHATGLFVEDVFSVGDYKFAFYNTETVNGLNISPIDANAIVSFNTASVKLRKFIA